MAVPSTYLECCSILWWLLYSLEASHLPIKGVTGPLLDLQDGSMFKAQVQFAPYFYLQIKVCQLSPLI